MKVARDLVLGLLFFGTLLLLIGATVFLSERLWGRAIRIPVLFEQAIGLKAGDPVLISGVSSGYVESITLNASTGPTPPPISERVRVVLAIRSDVPLRLFENYKIVIESASALGGHDVNIDPGDPSKAPFPIDERQPQTLRGEVKPGALEALSDLVDKNKDKVANILTGINVATDNIRSGPGLLHAIIMDAVVAERFKRIVQNIDEVAARIERGEGTLGGLLKDDKIKRDVESILAKIDRGEGLLAKILNDKTIGDDAKALVASAKEVVETIRRGEGSIGKLVMSSEAHDKLVNLEDKIGTLVDKIGKGDGLLGRIINDKKLGDDLADALRSIKEIVGKVNRGEGSLGRLIHDDTLVRNLERVIRSLGRSIEDAREAAPIATFSSVLFGAF